MNALLCRPYVTTDTKLHTCDTFDPQEDFATQPMQAVNPLELMERSTASLDEEALHVSFEEAISDRVEALNISWGAGGSTFAVTGPLQPTTLKHAIAELGRNTSRSEQFLLGTGWQRRVTYICLALMFMLIGFDLMGLLFLHLH